MVFPSSHFSFFVHKSGRCTSNAKGQFLLAIQKIVKQINFPKLESLYIHPPIDHRKGDNIPCHKTLEELVLNMPNLRFVQFGDGFFKSNLTFNSDGLNIIFQTLFNGLFCFQVSWLNNSTQQILWAQTLTTMLQKLSKC